MPSANNPATTGGATSRRSLLAAASGMLVPAASPADAATRDGPEPFHGEHQAGILTPPQCHSVFATFDLIGEARETVIALLQAWTQAAAQLTGALRSAQAAANSSRSVYGPELAIGTPDRLTLTFGFGGGLFVKNGRDRYGLAARRPTALVDLPAFRGDRLDPARCGGDLSAQACANDPQTAFHAVRELVRLGHGRARLRWTQNGFRNQTPPGKPSRSVIGFPELSDKEAADGRPSSLEQSGLWVADEGPAWMVGGSYLVTRRIAVAIELWDRMTPAFQEHVIGRRKDSIATPVPTFDAAPLRPHAALGRGAVLDGAGLLRRAYSFNDGARFISEPWPPWHQGVMFDAGLHFLAYQRDPRTGFIPIYEKMSQLDALNQFVIHTGSCVFACPPGVRVGGYIGDALFQG